MNSYSMLKLKQYATLKPVKSVVRNQDFTPFFISIVTRGHALSHVQASDYVKVACS